MRMNKSVVCTFLVFVSLWVFLLLADILVRTGMTDLLHGIGTWYLSIQLQLHIKWNSNLNSAPLSFPEAKTQQQNMFQTIY